MFEFPQDSTLRPAEATAEATADAPYQLLEPLTIPGGN